MTIPYSIPKQFVVTPPSTFSYPTFDRSLFRAEKQYKRSCSPAH